MLKSRADALRLPPEVREAGGGLCGFGLMLMPGAVCASGYVGGLGTWPGQTWFDGEVDLAIRRTRWSFTDLPFFVAFASMRTLANAWCTSRRLSAGAEGCLWGCAAVGGEGIRHY